MAFEGRLVLMHRGGATARGLQPLRQDGIDVTLSVGRRALSGGTTMTSFESKTVIVSGAAQGLGASHARSFVAAGANVVVADVNATAGRELCDELGPAAVFTSLDVREEKDWLAAVELAETHYGSLNCLVNNAGILDGLVRLEDLDATDWRRVIDVNLTGAYLGIKSAVPAIRRAGGGAIVNTSSALGFVGTELGGPYVASKFAIRGLTRVASIELASAGIRVNCVCPGYVRTPMNDGVPEESTHVAPMARFAEPVEVSNVVRFLCSEEASFITGADYLVDGGASAGIPPILEASASL
jgi:3alpha(or 20beta)-hydroxysteroid dehydrogenase